MSEEATLDEFAQPSDEDDSKRKITSRFWGEVPEDWRLVDGSEVYDVNPNPKSDEEPNTYIEMDALDTVLPWPKYFGTRNASEYSGKTFTKGDTLFARITPCTENGKAALVPEMETEVGIGSTEYAVLSPKRDSINPWLLYYISKSYAVHNYAISRMRGSTGRQRVPFSVFRKELDIALPPLPEQRKIATVLYTVDRVIEKTKEVINQVRRVRDGVRQDIFSHGIRQSGIERAEDELKETYLGNIPNNWQLRRVDEVCSHVVDCPHSTPDYSGEGTVVVRTSEIEEGRYYPAESPRVDEEGYQKRISRLEPKPGDVVFTREAPIGESFKIPDGMRLCLGQRLVQLRPKDDILNGDYLVELLYSDMLQNWFERSARGSTSKHINVEDIEGMEIPVPSIEEQRRIVEVLGGFREQIDSERNLLNSYERLKHGLQQDILSGTVRTTDTNIEVPDEIAQHG